MTNINVEKKKNTPKNESYTEVNNYKKWNKHWRIKRDFTKTILAYGKDVNHVLYRMQTTGVLLTWKYVRQAVGRTLYTLEQFTISEAKIYEQKTK